MGLNDQEKRFLAIKEEINRQSLKSKHTRVSELPVKLPPKKPISIIIYAYKIEDHIEECLNSIEKQSWFVNNNNFEIIIGVDDCKNTSEKLYRIKDNYRNIQIYHTTKHKGTFVTLNTLLDMVKYDIILPFMGDDIMKPEMIEEILKYTDEYDIVKFDYQDFDEEITNKVNNKFWFNNGIFLLNKHVVELVGGYKDWIIAADIELLERVYNHVKIKEIKESLFYKRQNKNDFKLNKDKKLKISYDKQIKKYKINENIKIDKIVDEKNIIQKFEEPTIKEPISILITAWQTKNFIEECLDSIEKQTYFNNNDNYEILLGIDACQDTLDKVINIKNKYRNLHIFMMSENKGTYVTTNTLLDLVKFENIIIFGSDDIMKSTMISKIMYNKKDYDVVRFGFDDFKENINNAIKNNYMRAVGAIFYKKNVIDLAGGYRDWRCSGDFELLRRIENHIRIKEIDDSLFYRRSHPNSLCERDDTGLGTPLRKEYNKQVRSYKKNENIKIDKIVNSYIKIGDEKNEQNPIVKYKNLVPVLLNDKPLVSIIIAYNVDRGFLKEAIESVEKQTYKNIELILSHSNNRVGYNLNKAFRIASGTYIKYLDEDDTLPIDSIENSVNTMLKGDFDFIHGNVIEFNVNGIIGTYVPRKLYPTLEDLIKDNVIEGGTLMYHKRVFKNYGLYDEILWSAEEYDFNLKLLNRGAKLGYCDKVLSNYRRHHKQKSLGTRDIEYQKKREIVRQEIIQKYSNKNIIELENIKYKNLTPVLLNGLLNTPLVSIIIPYNKNRGFLKEAIESVEKQTYKNIELIFSYSEKCVSFNLNRGIEQSSGTYIRYLCEDDILPEDSIENSISAIMTEDFDFIHGNSLDFKKDKIIKYVPSITNPDIEDLLNENVINGGTVMYHKRVFNKYDMFDENLWTAEEYDFNLKLLSNRARLGYCNKFLYKYRLHPKQKSIGNKSAKYQEKRNIIREEIKNRYVKKLKYNIFAAIPVNGRHELLPHTIKRLLNKCGIAKVYCIGDNKEDKRICEEAGAEWVTHENSPLGKKWNAGINAAIKSGVNYDGFVFIGSSDWISENWIDIFAPYLSKYDMVGTTNCYFLDINTNGTKELIHWKGYSNYRKGEAIGIGRLYSMRIIKKMNGKIFPDDLDTGMDLYSLQNILNNKGKIKTLVSDNAKTLSISTNKWTNKHLFEKEVKVDPNSENIVDVYDWLKTWFPEGFNIFSNRIEQIYTSKSVESFKSELKEKYKLKDYYDKNKPVFIFGMHRKEDYDFALNHVPYKVIFWCGSDAMNIKQEIYQLKNVTHLVGSKFVSDDLTNKGIKHLFVPVTTASFDLPLCPRGDSIYFYYSTEDSKNFYGFNILDEIKSRTKLNIITASHNKYSHEQLIEIYKKCFVGLRLTQHDGIPTTGCELGLMGRKIVHNGNQPNALNYKNIDDIINIINEEYKNRDQDNTYISEEMKKFLKIDDNWLYVYK